MELTGKSANSRSGFNHFSILSKSKIAQMKIQQMAFMLVAVFLFFVLVGLFFLSYYTSSIKGSYTELQREQALSSLKTISDMPELTCGELCLDVDKLNVMSNTDYSGFWQEIASIEVYRLYPSQTSAIKCPGQDCNYWQIYDSSQVDKEAYSIYVSLCKTIGDFGGYEKCEIGKLAVGVKIKNE